MMTTRRFFRLLAGRWKMLLLVGIVGAVSGVGIARYSNERIEPQFRAEAGVVLLTGDEESKQSFQNRLSSALARARDVNSALLADDSRLSIRSDNDRKQLIFEAVASSASSAETRAATMRDAYVSAAPAGTIVEQLEQAIAESAAKVSLLEEQISDFGSDEALDPRIEARRRFLQSQIASLEERAAVLALELAYPELSERDPELVEEELAGIEQLLVVLNQDLAVLPAPELHVPSAEERLEKMALERRLRNEEARYLDLAVRLANTRESGGFTDEVLITDETASMLSEPLAGGTGLALGLFLALGLLLFVDRVRRPVWGDEDLEIPGLGVVPVSRPGISNVLPWYPTAQPGARRLAVQGVRTALDGSVGRLPATVAITGLRSRPDDVHALAADLAAAAAVSGREVLLVDADFNRPSTLPEFGAGGVDLATALSHPDSDPEAARAFVKETLVNTGSPLGRLRSLRAGAAGSDYADVLAGKLFGYLVEEARALNDLTLIVAPTLGSPDAETVCARLDHVLIVGRQGVTTELDIDDATRSLELRGGHPLGFVLLSRKRRRTKRRPRHTAKAGVRRRRGPRPQSAGDDDKSTDPPRDRSRGVPSAESIPAPVGAPRRWGPDRVVSVIADYLAAFLERDPRSSRKTHGVLPLVEGCGVPTAVSTLADALQENEVDLERLTANHLAGTEGREDAVRDYLFERFFVEHVGDTNREPIIWHISSQYGGYQAFVFGPNFGPSHIRWIRRKHLASQRKRASRVMSKSDDTETRYRMKRFLNELDRFDSALVEWEQIRDKKGSGESSRRRRREGSRDPSGFARDLATLQQMGLLSSRVFDDQDLRGLTAGV